MALKSTKSKSNKEKFTSLANDDSSNPDEEDIVLIVKKFTKFFWSKKSCSYGFKRDRSSRRVSRAKRRLKIQVRTMTTLE